MLHIPYRMLSVPNRMLHIFKRMLSVPYRMLHIPYRMLQSTPPFVAGSWYFWQLTRLIVWDSFLYWSAKPITLNMPKPPLNEYQGIFWEVNTAGVLMTKSHIDCRLVCTKVSLQYLTNGPQEVETGSWHTCICVKYRLNLNLLNVVKYKMFKINLRC